MLLAAAVGGVLVLLVAVVCLLWACRYRSRSQAQRMIPMDVFPLTNPVFFDMLSPGVEEDPMEFPREQLRLIEVIGMYMYVCVCVYVCDHGCVLNPLPTLGNSLKKQKSLYRVLTPSINPHINSYWLMGAHDAYMRHWLVKG